MGTAESGCCLGPAQMPKAHGNSQGDRACISPKWIKRSHIGCGHHPLICPRAPEGLLHAVAGAGDTAAGRTHSLAVQGEDRHTR